MPSRVLAALPCALCLLACEPARAERLPETVVPSHYDLAFDVNLAGARFGGIETIRVTLTAPSRHIVLHALDIQFQEVMITADGAAQSAPQKAVVTLNAASQTAILTVPSAIPKGPADLHIRYTGILNDKLRGFYLSKANGRRYAVTQFESTDARRAFPSFDEPAYKATFSVSLTIDRGDTAISNGRLVSDTPGPGDGRHTLTFSETPKMSSYLVAMAVGDFECASGEADGIPIRICATPDKKDLRDIALDAAQRILAFYNRYYAIAYPFGKLDVVAVPDFAAGAMENTAAIFYREEDLLADSQTASVSTVKRIWSVLAHEMSHQWFGDLVTMRWWDDLWLNEGFATWMEKRPLAAAKPEWKMELDEVLDTQKAMNLDVLGSTRPIHAKVETPDEIEGSFDTIAYEKGGSVMRMVEGYLGPETFRTGVNAYLARHAYGNATSEDFWTAMAEASGKPVDRILPTFVNQPGVPLVEATLACRNGRSEVTLTDQRFFTDAAMARTVTGSPSWQVPICIKTSSGDAPFCQVMSGSRATIPIEDRSCVKWALLNAGAQGYFRTAYDPALLSALAPDVATRLSEAERLTLIGDEWALVRAGRHTIANYLTLASGLGAERASGVLGDVATVLKFAHDYLTTDLSRPPYEQFVRSLLGPILDELGLEASPADDDDRRELRPIIVGALGTSGNDLKVVEAARRALDKSLAGGPALEPSAADAIVGVAARHGDAGLWDRLLAASNSATSPAERYRYLYALPAFEDPALVDRGLNFALTLDLRSQDAPYFLGRYFANPAARARAWTFMKAHWTDLAPKITIALGDVSFVQSMDGFCDAATRDDIKAFFAVHRLPAASRALTQTLERIGNCAALRDKQAPALTAWLTARQSP